MNTSKMVVTEWSGLQDIPEEHHTVAGASSSGTTYTGSLIISPLADQDDGTYTCTATITGESNFTVVTTTVMGMSSMHVFLVLHFSSQFRRPS